MDANNALDRTGKGGGGETRGEGGSKNMKGHHKREIDLLERSDLPKIGKREEGKKLGIGEKGGYGELTGKSERVCPQSEKGVRSSIEQSRKRTRKDCKCRHSRGKLQTKGRSRGVSLR